jgi:Flp pilus assembly protein TadG
MRRRRGGSLVEMAIGGIVLIILTFGVCEAGWFFYCKNIMAGAAREGCRNGILQSVGTVSGNSTSINNVIINYLGNAGLIPHGTTAVASGSSWVIGNYTVTFYDYNFDTNQDGSAVSTPSGGNVLVGDGLDVHISASWAVIGEFFRSSNPLTQFIMPASNSGNIVAKCIMRKEAE